MSNTWRGSLESLAWFMRYWRDNFSAAYDLNRVFLIGSDNLCMANFGLRDMPVERDTALKALHERINKYRNAPQDDSGSNLYWISEGPRPGVGYFYVDASLSGEPVAGAFGCRADHPDGELFLTGYVADGGYHS